MHSDHNKYFKFMSAARMDKSINSLLGFIEGIAVDCVINSTEISFLNQWLKEHEVVANRHPFNELFPVVQAAIADGVLTEEEHDDIAWLCERVRSTEYFNRVTADLQRLHAILGGVTADGLVNKAELRGLSTWLMQHEHLRTCWPYDEVDSLITSVLADQRIDASEHQMLKEFFSEFTAMLDDRTITSPVSLENASVVGVCAVCPEIDFKGSTFCFTGAGRLSRTQFFELVTRLGGEVIKDLNKQVNFLVIGAEGNPCWAYACYGRKVEKAVKLRKQGVRIVLVHENDFHDSVADQG
jgi:NAD-dependent DNA ligase